MFQSDSLTLDRNSSSGVSARPFLTDDTIVVGPNSALFGDKSTSSNTYRLKGMLTSLTGDLRESWSWLQDKAVIAFSNMAMQNRVASSDLLQLQRTLFEMNQYWPVTGLVPVGDGATNLLYGNEDSVHSKSLLAQVDLLAAEIQVRLTDLAVPTPPLYVHALSDKELLIEWPFPHFRVGFSVEVDPDASEWFFVTDSTLGEPYQWGYLKMLDYDLLISKIARYCK